MLMAAQSAAIALVEICHPRNEALSVAKQHAMLIIVWRDKHAVVHALHAYSRSVR
jgi:hypothetical protein